MSPVACHEHVCHQQNLLINSTVYELYNVKTHNNGFPYYCQCLYYRYCNGMEVYTGASATLINMKTMKMIWHKKRPY